MASASRSGKRWTWASTIIASRVAEAEANARERSLLVRLAPAATRTSSGGFGAEGEHRADPVEEPLHHLVRGSRLERASVGETDAAPGDDHGELLADVGVPLEDAGERVPVHFQESGFRESHHRRATGLAGEDRHFAEERSAREAGDFLVALDPDGDLAAGDEIEGVADLALADHRVPRTVLEVPGALCEELAILGAQGSDEIDAREQVVRLGEMLLAPPLLRLGSTLAEADRLLRVRLIDPRAPQGVPDGLVDLVESVAPLRVALRVEAHLVERAARLESGEQDARRGLLQGQRARRDRLAEHRLAARRRHVHVEHQRNVDRVVQVRAGMVDHHLAADERVGDEELVVLARQHPRRAPADVEHLAAPLPEADELALLEGLLGVEGEAAEEVPERLLEREAQHDREERAGGDEAGEIEPVLVTQDERGDGRRDRPDDEAAEDSRDRDAPQAEGGEQQGFEDPQSRQRTGDDPRGRGYVMERDALRTGQEQHRHAGGQIEAGEDVRRSQLEGKGAPLPAAPAKHAANEVECQPKGCGT